MSDTTPPEAYPAGPDEARPGTPPIGAATPLGAPYCAERACAAIGYAEAATEAGNATEAAVWLACAEHWRALACSLATNAAMNRPREDRDNPRR